MNTSAIVVQPKSITMTVTISEYRFKFEDGIWRGKLDSRESSIYYGLVFRSPSTSVKAGGSITCKGMALVWADSPSELNAVIKKVTNWEKAQSSARKWADSRSKSVKLTADSSVPEVFEINQRALDSVQFLSGAMIAALDGGYMFTWVRDTTNAAVFAAQAGDPRFLAKWAPYLMRNASNIEQDGKTYRSFFTFPGDGVEYGKKEQDGQFYGILTAYSYWKLTGDSSKLKEWYPILTSCMEYQRKYYFDQALGLYWETSINEASLKSAPEWLAGERFPALKLIDDWPMHNLGIYINNLMYASHLMLGEIAAEVGRTSDSVRNLRMADELADAVHRNLWNPADGYYRMGLARMETGELRPLDWNYWDSFFDYIWAYTLYPMTADPERSLTSLDAILHKREGVFPGTDARLYFAPAYAHASYVYSAAGQNEKAKVTLDRLTKRALDTEWSGEMNALYMMRGTIPELMWNVGIHRPEIFAIGPWMHAAMSRIAYIDYNGVTVVPSSDTSAVKDIAFRKAVLSIDTGGSKDAKGLVIDGVPTPHTLRVPNVLLSPGRHSIRLMRGKSDRGTVLTHTDFELLDVKSEGGSVTYNLRGYGNGVLRFRDTLAEDRVSAADPVGKPIGFRIWSAEGGTRIQVNAKGAFRVKVRE
ncbi:MAG: MGH1-like glycoside hydrolase domain-containing protein [Armatimonadota bacterium]